MDQSQHDKELWRLAKKRAAFRRHLATYFIINAFFWGIWWFTSGREGGRNGVPWPAWVMLGWGVGLALSYFNAYGDSKQRMAEKEYERLKKEKEGG